MPSSPERKKRIGMYMTLQKSWDESISPSAVHWSMAGSDTVKPQR
jgi:hypothetical protein